MPEAARPAAMMIAIDGPAASGKGTLARRIARHYRLHHLDTGLTYRAVAEALLAQGTPLDDASRAATVAATIDVANLDPRRLATEILAEGASRVAVIPEVRTALVKLQRDFAVAPPGAVLDGRDIGTVVLPDADVKLYVTADVATRAKRRVDEIAARGGSESYDAVLADLVRRDARDSGRKVAPLKAAPDAYLLDTTGMDIETAFRAAVEIVERAMARSH